MSGQGFSDSATDENLQLRISGEIFQKTVAQASDRHELVIGTVIVYLGEQVLAEIQNYEWGRELDFAQLDTAGQGIDGVGSGGRQ